MVQQCEDVGHPRRSHLILALDFQSLDVHPSRIKRLDTEVMKVVARRYGTEGRMESTIQRTRLLVMLDVQTIRVSAGNAPELDRVIERIVRTWFPSSSARFRGGQVKRVYAADRSRRASSRLGGRAGWRQGGTGEAADIVSYIASDSRSFCLDRPRETTLVLCTDNPEFTRLIEELRAKGVEVCLISSASGPKPELVAELRGDRVATLPRHFDKDS